MKINSSLQLSIERLTVECEMREGIGISPSPFQVEAKNYFDKIPIILNQERVSNSYILINLGPLLPPHSPHPSFWVLGSPIIAISGIKSLLRVAIKLLNSLVCQIV